MERIKLYFYPDKTFAYSLEVIREYMQEHDLKEIVITEAERITGVDCFYCKEFQEVGTVGEYNCGKFCPKYKPRNGKNGRCIHSGWCYAPTDKKFILKPKKRLKRIKI